MVGMGRRRDEGAKAGNPRQSELAKSNIERVSLGRTAEEGRVRAMGLVSWVNEK